MKKKVIEPKASTQGFTLIEVMVVVVIIAIVINVAVISFNKGSRSNPLGEESARLRSLIAMAGEEALLKSNPIGIDITEQHYSFLHQVKGEQVAGDMEAGDTEEYEWQPLDGDMFRKRDLPDELRITIVASHWSDDEENESVEEKKTPKIILLSSGEMTPFDLKITSSESDDYYRLTGSETGELSLEHVTP